MTKGPHSRCRDAARGLLPASGRRPWTVVIPFKGGQSAKSRLASGSVGDLPIGAAMRHDIAVAFLCDTIAAAQSVPDIGSVIVVSSDPALITAVPDIIILADPGKGLNAAVAKGLEWSWSSSPDDPVAVMTGDLPCLLPADLAFGLNLARHHQLGMVADLNGSGSTMISMLGGVRGRPHFGEHSREAHMQAGHALLHVSPESTLRADVDTIQDLSRAIQRGIGQRTRQVLSGLRKPQLTEAIAADITPFGSTSHSAAAS